MKRLLVLVLCLALILPVMTAQAASIADVIGRWYLVSVDGNGMSGENYVEFNRNKSVTLVVRGQNIDTAGYEWKFSDDMISIGKNGDMISDYWLTLTNGELTLVSNKLSVLTGDSRYVDIRLGRDAVVYDTPAMKDAETEDQFFGEYEVYLAEVNGQYMSVESGMNGFVISLYVCNVYNEGMEPVEYLTNFEDGKLIVYAAQDTVVSLTEDPDVVVSYAAADPGSKAYLRRKDARPAESPEPERPVLPVATPKPEVTEAPAPVTPEPKPEQPAKPVFPGMIMPSGSAGKSAPAANAPVSAYFGNYIVYQNKLANGRVLDMSTRGLQATVDVDGVHASAYGQNVTVPYAFENGVMTANISALYPDYSFAAATLGEGGELIVTLADATGYVGETLYLKPVN